MLAFCKILSFALTFWSNSEERKCLKIIQFRARKFNFKQIFFLPILEFNALHIVNMVSKNLENQHDSIV